MRRVVVVLLSLPACGYPEYGFVASEGADSAGPGEDVSIDSTARDDTTADTFATDAGTDDGVVDATSDTLAADTLAADTSASDTPALDTSTTDTAPVVETSIGCVGSTALFCEDWDDASVAKAKFDWVNVDTTASLALEATGRSSPNALVANVAPGDAAVVTADLGKYVIAPTADALLRVDVWLKLETLALPTATGGAFLFKVERGGTGSVGDGITFSIDDKGFYVDRIGLTYALYRITYKPVLGAWVHVRMDAKLHTSAGAFTVWIDDMVTPKLTDSAISTVRADTTARNFIVGLYANAITGAFRARFDDVSIAVAP